MPYEPTKLVLGRGEVYFDRFIDGTRIGEGERYLGNTSTFRVQRETETKERATSHSGKRIAMPPAVISEGHSVDFITDHIDAENIALWLGSSKSQVTVSTGTITESFLAKRGRFYQLGKSQNFAGTRFIRGTEIRVNGVLIPALNNYEINEDLGRLYIIPHSLGIPDGATFDAQFTVGGSDSVVVKSKPTVLYGALRFVAFNEGVDTRPQNDYFFPFVGISPRGQVDLKGDEFQQIGFDATAMTLAPNVAQLYVTRVAKFPASEYDQQVIIGILGSFELFVTLEDRLDVLVNQEWPPAVDIGVL